MADIYVMRLRIDPGLREITDERHPEIDLTKFDLEAGYRLGEKLNKKDAKILDFLLQNIENLKEASDAAEKEFKKKSLEVIKSDYKVVEADLTQRNVPKEFHEFQSLVMPTQYV
ncbi:MAG: hypothetical protein V1818_00730 [Candidatus Aenigmatarchaeota archaeon]